MSQPRCPLDGSYNPIRRTYGSAVWYQCRRCALSFTWPRGHG
jgi:hypothetical protein